MGRKRKYQYITDPVLKASVVIEKFVDEAKKNVDSWSRDYRDEIKNYTVDENRQTTAAVKLAGFYEGITQPEVKNAIRDAVNKAKDRQAEVVSGALGRLPAPMIPREAQTTAKKVAEILGVTVPAPAV